MNETTINTVTETADTQDQNYVCNKDDSGLTRDVAEVPKTNSEERAEEKSSAQREHIQVPFEIKQIQNEDPDFFIFEGYASTFNNVDLGDDIVMPGAFRSSLAKKSFKILWQHDMKMPLGVPVEAFEDDKGLYIKAKLPKDDSFVRERVIPQLKVGSIDSMSIGFVVEDFEFDKNIRKLKQVNLFEVSLVTMPMNPQAVLTGFKAAVPFQDLPLADRDREWDSSSAISNIRSKTNSEDSPSDSYKNAFLWYDASAAGDFGAYKLPIADVIDGNVRAIPRAIFAAAAALSGARGGVDIPDADKQAVISSVNKYYAKMRQKFGDDSIVSPLEGKSEISEVQVKSVDEITCIKDVELILKERGGFSGSERKTLISKIKDFSKQRDVASNCETDTRDAKSEEQLLNDFYETINFIRNLKND